MAVIDLFRRDDGEIDSTTSESDHGTYTPLMANLVTALIVVMLAGLLLSGALFYLRWRRRRLSALRMQANLEANAAFANSPPQMSQNASLRAPERPSHHRRNKSLTTPPHSPVFVVGSYDDKDSLMDEKRWEAGRNGSVGSVPEIHLTFPEELDEKTGKRESKVVVVTVTDKGNVGMQPYSEEPLPPYLARDNGQLKSLDLDRIGGLKEQK